MGVDVLLVLDELLELLLGEPVGDVGDVGPVRAARRPSAGEVLRYRRDPHANVAHLDNRANGHFSSVQVQLSIVLALILVSAPSTQHPAQRLLR